MKTKSRIAFIVLILLTLLCMFLPIASFEDNTAASIAADVEKQQGRVESEQAKLDRYVKGGKDQATLDKQKTKIEKEQAKLDDLLAKQEELLSADAASGLSYSLLPGRLPDGIEIDM